MSNSKLRGLAALVTISALMTSLGCSDIENARRSMDAVQSMGGKMDQTNDKLNRTDESIRLQKALISLQQITSDASMDRLYPVPTGLMPYAKTFAETATAREIVELTYLWLKEVDEVQPLKSFNDQGVEVARTAEQESRILIQKYGRIQALMAIAGFLPAATLQSLIETEITNNGRFAETGLNVLMMRVLFLRMVMLEESLYKRGSFASVGEAEEALKYMNQVQAVLDLPFASALSVKTRGLVGLGGYDVIQNLDFTLNAEMKSLLSSGWNRLADLTLSSTTMTTRTFSNDPAKNASEQKQLAERRAAVLSAAQAAIERIK